MAAILKKSLEFYHHLFTELGDPRTASWFLVGSPIPGVILLGLYLSFVLKWGPAWMKTRKPFNLDKVLLVYNIVQMALSAYIFIEGIRHAWGWKYKWVCEPCDFSDNEENNWIATLVHLYFLVKVVDLLDTVFFVLRKKNNQVTFLHVYHHTGMVMMTWGATKYLPGGHGTFIGLINSFVHVVMYGYYLLSIVDPTYKQSLWWKKYITQLQIVQFLWLVIHFLPVVFMESCDYPRWTAAIFLPQNFFMLILFMDFYRKTYLKKPQRDDTAVKSETGNGISDLGNGKSELGNGFEVRNGKSHKGNLEKESCGKPNGLVLDSNANVLPEGKENGRRKDD